MRGLPLCIRATVLAVALLAAPAAAVAQAPAPVPAREGDIWDWRDHQPTETQVQQNAKAAGVAPTQSQRNSTAATVDHLYQQLMDGSVR